MKKKFFIGIFIIVFILLLNFIYFVTTIGMYSSNPPSFGERISLAFNQPLWLSPSYTAVISVSNPIFTLFLIVLIVILYYLYDNFVKSKKDIEDDTIVGDNKVIVNQDKIQMYDENSKIEFSSSDSLQKKVSGGVFKKLVIWSVPIVIIWVTFVFLKFSEPGMGLPALIFLMPVMPVIYIFYPVYFIILSVRYSKEKSGMDLLDKIMFYILAVPIISIGFYSAYRVFSENAIHNLLDDRQEKIERKMAEKQKGPADLVVKDFSFSLGGAGIRFCNESTNATGGKVAIKIETDKGFSDIIENYPSLQPGECEGAQIVNENYLSSTLKLKKGESVEITVTVDPKNKIIETNEENNTLTKKFNL